MRPRRYFRVGVGNSLEIIGAISACVGVYLLLGIAWCLIVAGVLLTIGAELVYDAVEWLLPLPHKPRIRTRLLERRQAFNLWRATRRARRRKPLPPWPADDIAPETLRPR